MLHRTAYEEQTHARKLLQTTGYISALPLLHTSIRFRVEGKVELKCVCVCVCVMSPRRCLNETCTWSFVPGFFSSSLQNKTEILNKGVKTACALFPRRAKEVGTCSEL